MKKQIISSLLGVALILTSIPAEAGKARKKIQYTHLQFTCSAPENTEVKREFKLHRWKKGKHNFFCRGIAEEPSKCPDGYSKYQGGGPFRTTKKDACQKIEGNQQLWAASYCEEGRYKEKKGQNDDVCVIRYTAPTVVATQFDEDGAIDESAADPE